MVDHNCYGLSVTVAYWSHLMFFFKKTTKKTNNQHWFHEGYEWDIAHPSTIKCCNGIWMSIPILPAWCTVEVSRKQVSHAGRGGCIPQYSVGCNYLSMPGMPASGAKVFLFTCYSFELFSIKSPYLSPRTREHYTDFILTAWECPLYSLDCLMTIPTLFWRPPHM